MLMKKAQAGQKSRVQSYNDGLGYFQYPVHGRIQIPYGVTSIDDDMLAIPTGEKDITYIWTIVVALACADYEKTNQMRPSGNRAIIPKDEVVHWDAYRFVLTAVSMVRRKLQDDREFCAAVKKPATWATVPGRRDVISYGFISAHFSEAEMAAFHVIKKGIGEMVATNSG